MRELDRDSIQAADSPAGGEALPALAVIGAGRAGSSIAAAAVAAGLDVQLADRETAEEACAVAEVALLCVPDREVDPAAALIAGARPTPRFVGHVSGALGLDALESALAAGSHTFGLHPLQTLLESGSDLSGAACAISGSDAEALALASALGERLGMRPFEINDAKRGAYHAAASIASNFLIALEESAVGLLAAAGIDGGRELLSPLVERTAANWSAHGGEALTGPIARGDAATVARHRQALASTAPELLSLYDELAARTRELAREPVA